MDPLVALRSAAEALRQRQFSAALAAAEQGLATNPDHPGLLGITALALLQLDRKLDAIPVLRRQLEVSPDDKAARFNLATVLTATGATAAARELVTDHDGHPGLARIAGYLLQEDGDFAGAASAYRAAVTAAPQDWESWNNLGNCSVALEQRKDAVVAFENAINAAPFPGVPEVFLNLGRALSAVEDRDARLRSADEAARRFPGHLGVLVELGLAQAAAGHRDRAEQTLRKAAMLEDHFGEAHLELGLLLENDNRLDELDQHIATCEDNFGPVAELAFLKAWSLRRRERFAEAREEAERIPDTINPIRTAQLRAEIAERLGDPVEAFRQFERMNQESRLAYPLPPGLNYRETIERQTAQMRSALPAIAPAPDGPDDPVFIVGSPRSGTTLLDTLLSALPELQIFEEQGMLTMTETAFPGLVTEQDAEQVAKARRFYFDAAEGLEGPLHGRRLVDKMPLHLTHLPTIQRLFPNAAIVLVERHPCDAVLSCFMANFAPNFAMQSFTDLIEAARTYDAIFTNFERACALTPLKIHRVRYERMTADLEAEMRPLLAFLGLPWRDEVLDNQASAARRGAVRTASYAQIGQPLYQRAVGRWRSYQKELAPVMPILQPWIERLGYGD